MANLVRQVGRKAAFELVAPGEPIDAARALTLGMVNRVTAPEALIERGAPVRGRNSRRSAARRWRRPSSCSTRCVDLPFEQALAAGRDVNKRMRAFRQAVT